MTDRTGFVSHIMPDPLAPECATCGAIMRRRGGCNPFAYECASCGGTKASEPKIGLDLSSGLEITAIDQVQLVSLNAHLAEVERLTNAYEAKKSDLNNLVMELTKVGCKYVNSSPNTFTLVNTRAEAAELGKTEALALTKQTLESAKAVGMELVQISDKNYDFKNTRAEAAEQLVSNLELEVRRRLWMGHGHFMLYGDDGEMQCNECRISDYKRGNLEDLRQQATMARIKSLEASKAANEEKAKKIAYLLKTFYDADYAGEVQEQVLAILNGGKW